MIVFKRNLLYKHVGMQIVPLLAHFNRSRYNDLQYISILRRL